MVENVEVGLTKDKLENNNTLKTEDVVSTLSNGSSDRSKADPSVAKGRLLPGKSTGLRVITNIANVEIIQNGGPTGDFMDIRDGQKEHPMLGHGLTNDEDDEVDCVLFKLATIQDNDASSSVTSDGGTGSDALSPSSLSSSSCTTPTETDGYGRRKSALKSPGLRPDTPSRKSVRFADALGLDLETVKLILEGESPPDIPEQAFRDLQIASSTTPRRNSLSLTFQQPSGKPDFMHKLWKQNVCLENALISDFMIIGTIKVINIDYHKRVIVRYTIDNWRTFNEILASYVYGSHNGPTDRFSFGVSIPRDLPEGGCVYFAIRYDVASKRFWDNNDGKDYSCICYCDGTDDAIGASAWTHFL